MLLKDTWAGRRRCTGVQSQARPPGGGGVGGVTLVFKVASGCAERIPRLPSATLPVSGADLRNWLVKVISIRTSMLMLELETYV